MHSELGKGEEGMGHRDTEVGVVGGFAGAGGFAKLGAAEIQVGAAD